MQSIQYTLKELAGKLDLPFQGDGNLNITGIRDLQWLNGENRPQPGKIYIVSSVKNHRKYKNSLGADFVLTLKDLSDKYKNCIIAGGDKQIQSKLIELISAFDPTRGEVKPDNKASVFIDPTAKIGVDVQVFPGAVIMSHAAIEGGAKIYPGVVVEAHAQVGKNTVIHSNSVIGARCIIGDNCIIHSCVAIGSDGFGFQDDMGIKQKIPQIGIVVIGNDVELGSGCTIDRAAIETTVIGDNSKFDNQVHIAHNCQLGKSVIIAACTGIAGSTTVGNNVMIGGLCAISDHITIADGAIIMSFSGVIQDVPQGIFFGIPVRPMRLQHKIHATLGDLPELVKKMSALEKKVAELEGEK